ncbi:MAG TPA: RES family NAD+ phosphorylase [Acidobacteriaceae bacterium]|nr:RES family NAD+ phosphorylase [Acidobacteriaceae bacterium]
MSGGSGVKNDLREHYTLLPAGTVLWHVYPSKYAPRTFNSSSRNRFALVPPPDQAMFYAGDSSACALWEAVLRNLVVDDKQPQHVDTALVEGRSIAQLRLLQEIAILDLRAPHFRRLSTNPARHIEWQRLCVVPEQDYGQTHEAARELLTAAPRAAGLSWHSRQITAKTAYVFYAPPLTPPAEFDVIDSVALDQPAGWALVDQALKIVGVERLGASALVKEVLDELPPDDLDDS